MRDALKLATVAAALTLGLGLAENAFATQRVTVSQTATSLAIRITQDAVDAQPAKVVIHVPVGLPTKADSGQRIGFASGHLLVRDAAGARVALQGDLRVDDPAKHATDACFPGPDADADVWVAEFAFAGIRFQLPVYVSNSLDSLLGTGKIELCFGPVDVPAGTPGRSPGAAQLLDLTLALPKTDTPLVGSPQWTSFFTPHAAGTARPDVAGTVEVRSLVARGSVTVSAKSTRAQPRTISFDGSVEQAGAPVAGARVQILARGKSIAVATTVTNGRYGVRVRSASAKLLRSSFRASVRARARDITSSGCAVPSLPNVPCVSATVSGFSASSRAVKVRSYAVLLAAQAGSPMRGTPPSAARRVLDRTLVCAMGQGWIDVAATPDVGNTPGLVSVIGKSTAGTFPFVGADTERWTAGVRSCCRLRMWRCKT